MPVEEREPRTTVIVSANLSHDLVVWLDLHLAQLKVAAIKDGKLDNGKFTRSNFIRHLILKFKCDNGKK